MKISFVNGVRSGDEVEFALPEITIGREDGNILRIPTEGVSRFHACLRQRSTGKWTVCDQGSTNGIKVNRVRISGERELADGDLIEIGDQMIRVSDLSAAPPQVIFNPIPSITPVTPREAGVAARPLEPEVAPGTAVEPRRTSTGTLKTEMLIDLATLDVRPDKLFDTGGGGAKTPLKEVKPRRRISNVTFYTVIICMAAVAISACVMMFTEEAAKGAAKSSAAAPEEPPLNLTYEKTVISPDNVFRFSMQLEQRSVIFTVDDIKSQRHFERRFDDISQTGIGILRSRVASSGILVMEQPSAPRGEQEKISRRLVIAMLPQVKELNLRGKSVPSQFEEIEAAISDFAETYGLQTISMTPEELKRQAETSFRKAEELYGNREAKPTNLRDAIVRYRLVVAALEQFSPPLPMWEQAKRQLAEAEGLRTRKLENLEYERGRANGIKDYSMMRQIFIETMALADEDSVVYDTARQRLFKLDRWLESTKK